MNYNWHYRAIELQCHVCQKEFWCLHGASIYFFTAAFPTLRLGYSQSNLARA